MIKYICIICELVNRGRRNIGRVTLRERGRKRETETETGKDIESVRNRERERERHTDRKTE